MFFRRNRRARAPRVSSKKLFRSYRPLLEQLESRVVPSLDFSGGFTGASSSLTLNGSAAIAGPVLRLTQHDHNGQAGSAFSNIKQDVTSFHTSFTFAYTDPHADGFTFCIQGGASTALGPTGGGLGYGPDEPGGTGRHRQQRCGQVRSLRQQWRGGRLNRSLPRRGVADKRWQRRLASPAGSTCTAVTCSELK